ncbi:hypothetical protein A2U01_0022518 [Trifolium medium]|uniref:Uncharacterized protein n=1 Tax=Trifolium medium TaxID=97028 RepID=A0A392NQ04_9FABA|nr:hypothetical protein [Trifolium medium]
MAPFDWLGSGPLGYRRVKSLLVFLGSFIVTIHALCASLIFYSSSQVHITEKTIKYVKMGLIVAPGMRENFSFVRDEFLGKPCIYNKPGGFSFVPPSQEQVGNSQD